MTTDGDVHTLELAELLARLFQQRTGRRAHLVVCKLHRSRLDANRNLVNGANGNPVAEAVWKAYHCAIEAAARKKLQ